MHLHFLVGCIIFIRVFHEDQFSEFGRLLSILLCLEVRFLFIRIMIIIIIMIMIMIMIMITL